MMVTAESPIPVTNRIIARETTFHAHAFRSENSVYSATEYMSARLRPIRSATQPPTVAPRNMPPKLIDVIAAITETEMCHWLINAGAAKENVLRSPSSKK